MQHTASHPTSTLLTKAEEERFAQLTPLFLEGKADAAQASEFEELRQKRIAARTAREELIAQLIKDITKKNISFAELIQAGLQVPEIAELYSERDILKTAKALSVNTSVKSAAVSQPQGSSKKREVKGYIKSIRNPDETGVWRAGPPSFFKEEGGVEAYKRGEPIDQWLVDPKDVSSKIKLLKNLEKKVGQGPSQEQLGDITAEAYAQG